VDVTPTPDEIETHRMAFLLRSEDTDTALEVALAAVLPLYRDRLLTELADETRTFPRTTLTVTVENWLRSKVGGDSG
jgi:hypothetical protein